MSSSSFSSQKKKLDFEIARLEKITNIKRRFKVVWIPLKQSHIEGKVEKNTITIYSQNIDDALETLQHEFVDCIVCDAIRPYLKLVNVLLSMISNDAYCKKEESVETLLSLCNDK